MTQPIAIGKKKVKNQMTVKTGGKNNVPVKKYKCTWEFATPVETWKRSTLLNISRQGFRYVIGQIIPKSVANDEMNMDRFGAVIKFMTEQTKGDKKQLAIMNEVCRKNNIKSEIQTHFIFPEETFAGEIIVPEDEDDDEVDAPEPDADDDEETEDEESEESESDSDEESDEEETETN